MGARMPLRILRATGDQYTAEASNVGGEVDWTIGPMSGYELVAALSARGIHSTEISDAVDRASIEWDAIVRRA